MSEFQVIGKSLPRVDAVEKVTGAARYAADMSLPGMLWGKFLRSPYDHARIVGIDVSKAEALPGVRAVLTHKSIGSAASLATEDSVHGTKVDQSLFAADRIIYQGQKIAAVAADSPHLAEDALDLIEVEYEALPAVHDVLEAIEPDAPIIQENTNVIETPEGTPLYNVCDQGHHAFGDVEQGFAESDLIVEGTYRIARAHQTYLEPHAVVAQVDATGKVTVWTGTQSIFAIRSGLASSLGIPLSKINVIGTTIGGGFGAKFGLMIHPYAVLLSQATGRPVKIVYSREEEFLDACPAPGLVIHLKTGVKKDGTLLARQATAYWNIGVGPGGTWGTGRIAGVYKIPNVKWDAYAVYTHEPTPGAYRAPNAPQVTFASEAQLDEVAHKLGIDPVELRLKNMAEEGDSLLGGGPLTRVAFKETLRKVAELVDWKNRKSKAVSSNGHKIGWGIAVGEWTNGAGPAGAILSIHEDGIARILYGKVDLTGTDTACAQIAAEVLEMPFEDIQIIHGDTDSSPYATGSGGSVVLFSVGNAVKRAAEHAREQILTLAAQELKTEVDKLAIHDKRVWVQGSEDEYVSFAELGQASLRTTGGPLIGTGRFANEPSHPVISAQAVQVAVDTETGKLKILGLAQALDVGRAINPVECEGQMQGGMIQGLGWGWTEQMAYDKERGNLNPNLLDYQLLSTNDLPGIDCALVEKESEHGPFGVKGIGEPPITPTVAALVNAVADATGVHVTEVPLTPERVYGAISRAEGKGPR
ncbi:MAG: xanthine dehydrogenase family protein molybdopterin-binding subunit [Armatimonadetes bacterium]|nr:xanthine dehydrogenase family protein molybdopterin-binding subunit [Armatimonadota bacterium]